MSSSARVVRTFSLVAGLALAALASARTIVISPDGDDNAAGTVSAPLATLNGASRKANAGDTIYLRGGTYTWSNPQAIDVAPSGNLWTKVASYPNETAIIDGSNMKEGQDMVHIAQPGVQVERITFTKARKSDLSLWNTRRARVRYCKFTEARGAGLLIGSSTPDGASDVEVFGCKILDNVQKNYKGSQSNWPPALQVFQATRIKITSCMVGRNFGEGIGYCRTTDSVIEGNTVFDNYSVNVYLDNVTDSKVSNNFIYSTQDPTYFRGGRAASGISCASEKVANPIGLARCDIVNNIVTNCFTGFWYSDFGLGGGLKDFRIENNTFYGSTGPLFWIDQDAGHNGNVVIRNIFEQKNAKPLVKGATARGFTLGSNCWFGGDPLKFSQTSDVVMKPDFQNPQQLNRAAFRLLSRSRLAAKKIGYGAAGT